MPFDLSTVQILLVAGVLVLAFLLLAYGIAGWFERRARRRREARARG